jgi:pimeloyl-ACP methyl ester carboxylesterase
VVTQVRNIPVWYEEAGAGRPLLMLHGRPLDHHSMLKGLEPVFAGRTGWRRLYPDLPGMGRTPSADWITSHEHMLDIVLGFIDAVAPGERFVAAGLSYGAMLARGLLQHRQAQLDGLLLLVPALPEPENGQLPHHQVVRREFGFEAALRPDEQDLLDFLVVQNSEVLEDFRSVIQPAVRLADNAALGRITQALPFELTRLSEPFLAPALMLCGRQDHWCGFHGAMQLLDDCPRGTLAVLDRAGHALTSEQRHLTHTLVGEWLDRVEEYISDRATPTAA